jgi:transcriptional regulator with GAF, ATPase, and Fis domain
MSSRTVVVLKRDEIKPAYELDVDLDEYLEPVDYAPRGEFEGIVGSSRALRDVLDQVRIVAPTDSTVLIEGETGTGKEVIASAIHQNSNRRSRPFIKLNCSAIPSGLLESELLGHENGAFTGAVMQKQQFRMDLYYRLNVFPISLSPLRLRPDDIPMLTAHFVRKYAARMSKRVSRISQDAMAALKRHPRPGNVRELQKFIERAAIVSQGDILQMPSLPARFAVQTENMTLAEAERAYILHTLDESKWVVGGKAGAAARLGLKRTTLAAKIRRNGLSRERANVAQGESVCGL